MKGLPGKTFLMACLLAIVLVRSAAADSQALPAADYREEMRQFVKSISVYAKGKNPKFLIISKNGNELLTTNGDGSGAPVASYLMALDGVAQESLHYGYPQEDKETPADDVKHLTALLDLARYHGKIRYVAEKSCWE
jgi:cysteinyl-tRNA synthetase, unknown class